MAKKAYRVTREVYEHGRIVNEYPEYRTYKMYLVEAPAGNYSYQTTNQYLLTHEHLHSGQSVVIDDDREILPLRDGNSTPHISGNKVFLYRPERMISNCFRIKAMVKFPDKPIENFGNVRIAHQNYYFYEAEQSVAGGYSGSLARIFTKTLHFVGMEIPMDELSKLPVRKKDDTLHFLHDTESLAYRRRVSGSLSKVS